MRQNLATKKLMWLDFMFLPYKLHFMDMTSRNFFKMHIFDDFHRLFKAIFCILTTACIKTPYINCFTTQIRMSMFCLKISSLGLTCSNRQKEKHSTFLENHDFSQDFSSLALMVWEGQYFEDFSHKG